MKKVLVAIAWIAGIIVGLFLLVLVAVSPVVKHVVEDKSPKWIGRQVRMDKLRINLFAGSVRIQDFSISEADMQTDFVTFDTLYVNMALYKLLAHEICFKHILLTDFDINVIQGDSVFNFSDLLALGGEKDTTQTDSTSSWAIGLYDIHLRRGDITYTDAVRNSSWNIDDFKLYVPGVYFAGRTTDVGLAFDFPEGGRLATQMKYDAEHNRYHVDLRLAGINLDMALPYVQDFVKVNALGGTLTANLLVDGSLSQLDNVNVTGMVQLDTLDVRSEQQKVMKLCQTRVNIARINPAENCYELDTVLIDGLSADFERYANSTNVSKLLVASDTLSADTVAEISADETASEPIHLLIQQTEVKNGAFTFVDHTLHSPMSYRLSDITLKAKNFTLDGINEVHLSTQLPEGGVLLAHWKGGLNFKETDQQLSLMLRNVLMKHLSPYAEYYVGNPLTDGVLSFTSENTIKKAQLKGINKIDIYNLQADKKNKEIKAEYEEIPLRMAVSLLKDLNQKIVFDVPVSGDINSPKFSYGKIVWKTVMNILVKAAASPVTMLAQALGLSGKNMDKVLINPLQPDFTSEQYSVFTQLSDILKQRSDVRMVLQQCFDINEVAADMGVFNLKRAYYMSQNEEKQTSGQLSFSDFNNINQISDRNVGLRAFVDSLTTQKSSLDAQAMAYYTEDSLQSQVLRLADFRNYLVANYFEKLGLTAEKIEVHTLQTTDLQSYKGKGHYAVQVEVMDTREKENNGTDEK